MKQKIGFVKDVKGLFKAVDKNDNIRILKAGDFIYEGEEVSSIHEINGGLSDSIDINNANTVSTEFFILIQDLRGSEMYLIPQGGYHFFDVQDMGSDETSIEREPFSYVQFSNELSFEDALLGPQVFLSNQVDFIEDPIDTTNQEPETKKVPKAPKTEPEPKPEPEPESNHSPELAGGDITGSVMEITDKATGENTTPHTATGTLNFTDADTSDTHTVSASPQASGYIGTFTPAVDTATGKITWDFSVEDAALDHLKEGQTLTQTYTITVDDGHGGTATEDVTVTITGKNDAPEPQPDTGSVSENSSSTTGNVLGNDTDVDGDTLTVTGVNGYDPGTAVTTAYGTITLNSDGSYTYTADISNPAVSGLNAGQTLTDPITYTMDDGNGGTVSTTLTITINGNTPPPDPNNAPVITGGETTETVTEVVDKATSENTTLHTATGTLNFIDADTSDTHTVTASPQASGYIGTFTPSVDTAAGKITWDFSVEDSALDHLKEGQTLTQIYTITVDDGHGGTATEDVTVTITGKNDAPEPQPDTGSVSENSSSTTGHVLGNDTDVDGDTLTVTGVNGSDPGTPVTTAYGTIALNPDGSYTYTPDTSNPMISGLNDGQTLTDTISYTVDDGNGGTAIATLAITITGTNNAPSIGAGNNSGEITELVDKHADENNVTHETHGSFTLTDPDTPLSDLSISAAPQNSGTGYLGTFLPAIDADSGEVSWIFKVKDADLDHLKAGETLTQTYTITVDDGHGGTTTKDVTVTLHGKNEGPDTNPDSVVAFENNDATGNVIGNDSDVDGDATAVNYLTVTQFTVNGEAGTVGVAKTITVDNGQGGTEIAGTLTLKADGTYTFVPATNWHGDVPDITYTIQDADGATDTAILKISIIDNTAPIIDLNSSADLSDSDTAFTTTYTEDGAPVSIADSDMGVADADTPNLDSATITLTNPQTGDALNTNGVDGNKFTVTTSQDGFTITLRPIGDQSHDDFEDAIKAITFETPGDTPNTEDRRIEVKVSDGNSDSNIAISTIKVAPVDDPPKIDLNSNVIDTDTGFSTTYTEGDNTEVSIAGDNMGVTDVDTPNLASATITLTNPQTNDVLNTGGVDGGKFTVTASSDGHTITLTPIGDQPQSEFVNAIKAITFATPGDNPNTEDRIIEVKVSDGHSDSNIATTTISVIPVNDPPTAQPEHVEINKNSATPVAITLTGDDPDSDISHFKLESLPAHGILYTDSAMTTQVVVGTDYPVTGSNELTLYFKPDYSADGIDTSKPFGPDWYKPDSEDVSFDFVAKDGDPANGVTYSAPATATITIDDVPVAMGESKTVTENAEGENSVTLTGNLLTDGGSFSGGVDYQGKDGAGATVYRVRYARPDGGYSNKYVEDGGSTFETKYGVLEVNPDGRYTYTPKGGIDHSANGDPVNDNFSYCIKDGNGDISNWADQNIAIADGAEPTIQDQTDSVNEANLPTGSDPNGDALTQTGSFGVNKGTDDFNVTFNYQTNSGGVIPESELPDVLKNLGSNGTGLTYKISNDGHTLKATRGADGPEIFTVDITNPTMGNAGYSFVLKGPLDNLAGGAGGTPDTFDLPFKVTVTDDDDGDNDPATLTVTVHDDNTGTTKDITLNEDTGHTFATTADATQDNTNIGTGNDAPQHGSAVVNKNGSITYTPDQNYSGTDTFTYQTTGAGGDTQTVTVTVTVNPKSDAPGLTYDEDIWTFEDQAVSLNLQLPTITDKTDLTGNADNMDNPERLGPISLTVPDGVQLLNGNDVVSTTTVTINGKTFKTAKIFLSDVPEGYHTATAASDANVTMTTAEYQALRVNPVPQSHKNFEVKVSVTEYEVNDSGEIARLGMRTTVNIPVDVKAVTDLVDLKLDGRDHSTQGDALDLWIMNEDEEFQLGGNGGILWASSPDTDGSETVVVRITNPAGNADIVVNGETIAGGASKEFSSPNLKIKGGEHFSGDINGIKVELVVKDHDGDSPDHNDDITEESDAAYLNLHVAPVAGDIPAEVTSQTIEDGGRAASTTGAKFLEDLIVTDTDGTESITGITITNIPAGWVIKDHSGNIVSQVKPADISNGNYKNYTALPPAHSSADASITLSVETTDTVTRNGTPQTVTATSDVTAKIAVTPVAEEVGKDTDSDGTQDLTMTPGKTYTTHATEDKAFNLNSDGFQLESGWTNQDTDEETFALLTPQIWDAKAGTAGEYVNAIGAAFTWTQDGQSHAATYTATGIKIPVGALNSVEFTAPPQSSGQFKIKVEAHTVDTDPDTQAKVETISGEAWLSNLIVEPKADKVTLGISQASGKEDQPIPLDIRPYSDDPGETFNVTIDKIPTGAVLTYDGNPVTIINGKATIEDYKPGKLTITPPPDSNVDIPLKVSAVSVDTAIFESGTQTVESTSQTPLDLTVQVQGVADDATLTVTDKVVTEADTDAASGKISLKKTITAAASDDNDNSETVTLVISGLAEGFNFEGGSFVGGTGEDREWMVSAADIAAGKVNVVVPENFNGKIPLNVKAVTTENDGAANSNAASATINLRVTPSPEATMNLSASGNEDTPVQLNFDIQHQNDDTDETINSVWISAAKIDSHRIILTKGPDGGKLDPEGQWYKIPKADLGNIYAKGASNEAKDYTFGIKYQVTDPDNTGIVNGEEWTENATYTLRINPVTDLIETDLSTLATTDTNTGAGVSGNTVTITQSNVQVSMNVTVSQKSDDDGQDTDSSETLHHLVIDGVPEGVSVTGGRYIGNTPGNIDTGQWIVDVKQHFDNADITKALTFNIQGTLDTGTSYPITITGVSQDGTVVQETASDSWTLATSGNFDNTTANHTEPAQTPTVTPHVPTTATEDNPIPLTNMLDMSITGSGHFSIALTGIPEGFAIDGMIRTTVDGHTIWTTSGTGDNAALQTLLDSLTVHPPEHWNSNENGPLTFNAALTTYADGNENRPTANAEVSQTITPVSDPTTIAISPGATVEDTAMTLAIDLSNAPDQGRVRVVNGKLYLTLDTEGKVAYAGSELTTQNVTAGQHQGVPAGDYYVLDVGNETTVPNATVNVTFTPPEHFSGDVTAQVYGATQENGAANTEDMNATASFAVEPANSGYNIQVPGLISENEDNRVQLQVNGTGLVDTDGSETAVSAILSNVPENYIVFAGADANNPPMANNIGNGTWELPLDAAGKLPAYIAVQAPKNVSGTAQHVELTVFSAEEGQSPRTDTATFDLNIVPVPDALTIDPKDSIGMAGNNVAINLNPNMTDTDGSETATVTFTGFGVGEEIAFSVGGSPINSGNISYDWDTDTYTITGIEHDELGTLTFTSQYNINAEVTVTARTVETENDVASTKVSDTFQVIVGGGQTPGPENDTIVLDLNATKQDGYDGEDTLVVGQSNVDFTSLGVELLNMEIIDLEGHGQQGITLDRTHVESMTDANNALLINGDGGASKDTVNLENGWTDSGSTEDINGITYHILDNGDAHLKIQHGVEYHL